MKNQISALDHVTILQKGGFSLALMEAEYRDMAECFLEFSRDAVTEAEREALITRANRQIEKANACQLLLKGVAA